MVRMAFVHCLGALAVLALSTAEPPKAESLASNSPESAGTALMLPEAWEMSAPLISPEKRKNGCFIREVLLMISISPGTYDSPWIPSACSVINHVLTRNDRISSRLALPLGERVVRCQQQLPEQSPEFPLLILETPVTSSILCSTNFPSSQTNQ